MKKLCRISDKDIKYPRGITPKIIEAHFNGKNFSVDVYRDLQGKLFYKSTLNWGNVGDVFIRFVSDIEMGKLYFLPYELYLKQDNDIHVCNCSYEDYEALKNMIARDMPVDTFFYRVLANGEWGYFDIPTPNYNGVICNAALFDAKESREKNLSIPEDLFPIKGYDSTQKRRVSDAKLGKLYVVPGEIYI